MPTETFRNLPDEKRQKFIEIAIDEFSTHDYESASVSQIVARAGIAKGSLYQYFTDKRDLHLFLLDLAAKKKAEYMAEVDLTNPDMNIFVMLRMLCRAMLQFQIHSPKLAMIGNRAIYGDSPLPSEIVNQAAIETRQFFKGLVEKGKNRGEIHSKVDADTAAFLITAALKEMTPFLTNQLQSEADVGDRLNADLGSLAALAFEQVISIIENGMSTHSPQKKD